MSSPHQHTQHQRNHQFNDSIRTLRAANSTTRKNGLDSFIQCAVIPLTWCFGGVCCAGLLFKSIDEIYLTDCNYSGNSEVQIRCFWYTTTPYISFDDYPQSKKSFDDYENTANLDIKSSISRSDSTTTESDVITTNILFAAFAMIAVLANFFILYAIVISLVAKCRHANPEVLDDSNVLESFLEKRRILTNRGFMVAGISVFVSLIFLTANVIIVSINPTCLDLPATEHIIQTKCKTIELRKNAWYKVGIPAAVFACDFVVLMLMQIYFVQKMDERSTPQQRILLL